MRQKLRKFPFKGIAKRLSDFCEKMSVGAFLYWIFQNSDSGIWIGLQFLLGTIIITDMLEYKNDNGTDDLLDHRNNR